MSGGQDPWLPPTSRCSEQPFFRSPPASVGSEGVLPAPGGPPHASVIGSDDETLCRSSVSERGREMRQPSLAQVSELCLGGTPWQRRDRRVGVTTSGCNDRCGKCDPMVLGPWRSEALSRPVKNLMSPIAQNVRSLLFHRLGIEGVNLPTSSGCELCQ